MQFFIIIMVAVIDRVHVTYTNNDRSALFRWLELDADADVDDDNINSNDALAFFFFFYLVLFC